MAAYPSIGMRTSRKPFNTRTAVDVSDAGGVRLADTGSTDVFEVTVEHPLVDSTDRATFWSWFATNRLTSNTITLDGTSYTCYVKDYPNEERLNSTRWNITVSLIAYV